MRYLGLDVHVPLGRPRFFEISAAAPPALYARYRRSTWRTLRPSRWATSVCVTRRWWTCSIHSARSNSRRLIVRVPRSMAGPIGRTRHFYLGETRHFHFGLTVKLRARLLYVNISRYLQRNIAPRSHPIVDDGRARAIFVIAPTCASPAPASAIGVACFILPKASWRTGRGDCRKHRRPKKKR